MLLLLPVSYTQLDVYKRQVYKKHGRSKDEDYVSEQLEFSDGPYVNEEDDEKEE